MKKISLRARITIFVGIVIMMTSLITSFFALSNYYRSAEMVEAVIDDNGEKVMTNIRSDTPIVGGTIDATEQKVDANYQIYLNNLNAYNGHLYETLETSNANFIASQIIVCLITMSVGMVIAYFVSGYILRPIKKLSEDVGNIDNLENAQPLALYNPKDELGILTRSFNDLIQRGKEYSEKQRLFASNVAHELKTPIAIMKASVQVLDETSDIEEYQEVFRLQEKNIDRLTNIINDLLVLKENNYKLEPVRVDEVILTCLKEQAKTIEEKGIKVHLNVVKLMLESNEGLMYRLISNLISNATKYNKPGGDIFIELDIDSLSVRDTGIGMEEKYLKSIFEPLFRIDKSRSKELGGSGLGLSIVKDICDTLAYSIEVNSKVDRGSEFIITFNEKTGKIIEKVGIDYE